MLTSHLTIVEASAARYASAPAFKVPVLDPETNVLSHWHSISYSQFYTDIVNLSRHWSATLRRFNIAPRSIISLWIGGFTYKDLLLIYSLSHAGYIPQMMSLRLPNPSVVFELIEKAGSKALIFDPCFANVLDDCPVHRFEAFTDQNVDVKDEQVLSLPPLSPDDTVFLLHTSGSTSGSPKVVPYSYRWLGSAIQKARQLMTPKDCHRQDVVSWMGSVCHVATSFFLLGSLQHGSCTIQPTSMAYDLTEFSLMIQKGGLNRLHQFAPPLAARIRAARQDSTGKLLSLLTSLDEVLFAGLSLPQDEQEYAYRNNIHLRNVFGSTECGAMLVSTDGSGFLRPLEGGAYTFSAIHPSEGHRSTAQMLELVIMAESWDCPHPTFRRADGHFHTGDLFQETFPGSGLYVYRGRDDDWIKSENALRCDTKAIEDNARLMCGDLISECVVVGAGRPSPALFVEPGTEHDVEKLKKEIIRRTRQFHSRRYLHERITATKFIFVVPVGTLPRTSTKGNVRRQAVEEAFKSQLDAIYA